MAQPATLRVGENMKVVCRGNRLSELLLTGIHRTYFESRFGPKSPPTWNAEIGREYTVYALSIHKGYPFYFVASSDPRQPFCQIPSLCFEIMDGRPSQHWRIRSHIVEFRGDQTFSTTFEQWFGPMFLSNLVDGCEPERSIMLSIAKTMDAEFESSDDQPTAE